ncbi:MAG: hypothetical protein ACI8Q1_001147 [Parvicella sp.]|jgi:hypothetical protein
MTNPQLKIIILVSAALGFSAVFSLNTFETKTDRPTISSGDWSIIDYQNPKLRRFIASPNICKINDSIYITSHEYYGEGVDEWYTYVSKTNDMGKSWGKASKIPQLMNADLISIRDTLYLFGTFRRKDKGTNDLMVCMSINQGDKWECSRLFENDQLWGTSPTSSILKNDTIWKLVNLNAYPFNNPNTQYLFAYASINKNLLENENWAFSEPSRNTEGIEPTVVVDNNRLAILYRYHEPANGGLAKLQYFNRMKWSSTSFIDLPGGCKKFYVQYDSVSRKYWTISNSIMDSDRNKGVNIERLRNFCTLSFSTDLHTWYIKDTLLYTPNFKNEGWQYIDWEFDRNDIIAVSRTAMPSEDGPSKSQHDANHLTFHRFNNFRIGSDAYQFRRQ